MLNLKIMKMSTQALRLFPLPYMTESRKIGIGIYVDTHLKYCEEIKYNKPYNICYFPYEKVGFTTLKERFYDLIILQDYDIQQAADTLEHTDIAKNSIADVRSVSTISTQNDKMDSSPIDSNSYINILTHENKAWMVSYDFKTRKLIKTTQRYTYVSNYTIQNVKNSMDILNNKNAD